ncbi:uncharacterized protein MELLADRAFT_87324 [Melampsora larici-populina 98AG31]|uniref:Uncharacterized protein n=1 Tax=Melampsora larici-populina (strain 98AG31 / pathotype 3-4-7) TaxID=747676 RepID=F4RMU5_MELLP|nr:uncharacterized protein MELLADRAFT_87324 [Melampsora larici-populina 98AG31]EGG06172.1 hypothetical protein MELLADRAFT_87324 [Melampsora larici-populina 98AG31]
MRNTRSQAVATSARRTITSTSNSSRGKRQVSRGSTDPTSIRKQIKITTRRAVTLPREENIPFDDEDEEEDEKEDEDALEAQESDILDDEDDEEEEESDSEEIFNRLANRINTSRPGQPISPSNDNHPASTDEDTQDLPSIKEYKNVVDQWPPARIAVVARSQKRKGTAVPPLILTEAKAIRKLYKQHKAMLSIMGNISELGGRRKPGCYQIWLKYSKERQKHKMPLKGGHKGILAKRNRELGKVWKALPDEHQEVFHPSVFYTLSGLNPPSGDFNDDDDDDAEQFQELNLDPEHRAELQELYDQLVCKHKVAKDYAKVAAGIVPGPSLPDYNRQSLKCIERLHTQIDNEANNMDFSYSLLACSTHASTEASSASPGWCREFTSHEEMAVYVNAKSNFATVFATRAQGLSVAEVVAQTIGTTAMTNSEKARKTDPGDIVKRDLAALLRSDFSALIGKEQGFPRGPDPVAILRDDYNLKIIQTTGSKLTSQILKLGFNKMNSRRSLWLEDVRANNFRMERINTPNTTTEEDINMDESAGEDQVTMTQDQPRNTADAHLQMDFEEEMEDLEEEEWNGFEEIDESEYD